MAVEWLRSTIARKAVRVEWPALLMLLVIASGIWIFVEIADEIRGGETLAFDELVLLALRDSADPARPWGPDWFAEMMRDFTALGGVGVLTLLTLAAAGYCVLIGKWHAALAVIAAVGGGILISTLVKLGFDRARPDLVPYGSHIATASFPSGHSMMSAVVYLTLGALLMRLRPGLWVKAYILGLAILLSILVGTSRVYLGVHWPTDVLAGWSVGAAWATLCWFVILWMQSEGSVEPEEDS